MILGEVSNELKECNVILTTSSTNSIVDSAVNLAMKLYDEDTSRLQIIYLNDKAKSSEIAKALEEQKKLKTLSLNATTKNDDIIKEIYKTNEIPKDIDILFMTKIGEEGISFNNEIFAIHTIGKIDSTVAEQLGNRPRKHRTKLFIHTKHKDKSDGYVLNPKYKEIEEKHLEKIEIINNDIKINELQYEERKQEEFFKFTLWDWNSSYVTLAPLAVSKFLYESDKINEFNFYDYYFKQKMNHYGWNVDFILDEDEGESRLNFKSNNSAEKRREIALKLFDLYKTYEDDSNDIVDFIDYVKSNISTNGLPDIFIENLYKDFSYLSNYVDDAIIVKAVQSTNRSNRNLNRLFGQIHRELHGGHRVDKFVYTDIEIGKEYTSDELQEFGQKYQDELNKYNPALKSSINISTQKANTILSEYFEIQKSSTRIHGKKTQVTQILKRKSILKPSTNSKKTKHITPEDISDLQEELYNTTCLIDFLAMDNNPWEHISKDDYTELLTREKELKGLVKYIEKDSDPKESNRNYSYIDEWL